MQQHMRFVEKRATRLRVQPPLRRCALLPLEIASRKPEQQRAEFAAQVREACLRLHAAHAGDDPVTGKRAGFGLVRMANIDPLFDVASELFALGAPEGVRIHLCVYHARFPLVQRSAIEHMLDTVFDRRDPDAVWRNPVIRAAIDAHPENEHLFVVLASPVCEVGRDWDADWAVVEPSSMRSLIQLGGRVQRHRRIPPAQPNMLVFDTNLRHFEHPGKQAYLRPGYEIEGKGDRALKFQLLEHRLEGLLDASEYETLTALPRISPRADKELKQRHRLADLEQMRTMAGMLPRRPVDGESVQAPETDHAWVGWTYPQAALIGVLPQQQPFRHDPQETTTLAFLPDEDEEDLRLHRVEDDAAHRGASLYVPIDLSQRRDHPLPMGERIDAWGGFDLMTLLAEQVEYLDLSLRTCAERFAAVEVPASERGWRWHPLLGFTSAR